MTWIIWVQISCIAYKIGPCPPAYFGHIHSIGTKYFEVAQIDFVMAEGEYVIKSQLVS